METNQLKDLSPKQLEDFVSGIGEKPYRARQIAKWLYQKYANSYEEMTDLSVELRDKLHEMLPLGPSLELAREDQSEDGTVKYLFELHDGSRIETVLIPESRRNTLCVSSQVGCALGFTFCLTGTVGRIRNLATSEIVDQVLFVNSRLPSKISNIVFMGMGEPLDNLENLVNSISILTDKQFFGMSPRRITVSTSGLVPKISELGERMSVNLSISLNASNDKVRNELMPINKKYPISALIRTAMGFPLPKRKLVTFEYVLISGVNDSDENAEELAELLKRLKCKINLIPFNEAHPLPYKTPGRERVLRFQKILTDSGINAKIRKNRGRDILGACGQLAADYPRKMPAGTTAD